MKKILFLMLSLILMGGANSYATKLYADLSKLGNGPVSTWDGATNTMTWTTTSNNMISNFDFAVGDYSSFESISITVSNLTNADGIRLQIRANGKEKMVMLNGEGTFTKQLIKDFGFTASDLKSVEWVRVLGSNYQNPESHTINDENPGSAVINDVYFYQSTKTLKVNLSAMASSSGTATWNKDTKVFAWTGTYSNSIALPGLSGNLSSYSTINYETVEGTCDHFRILIYYNNGASQTTYFASVGNKSVTFKEMGASEENLAHISSINISGANDKTGDIILNSFSLEGPAVNRIEDVTTQVLPDGTTDLNGITGTGDAWSINYPITVADATLFGSHTIDTDTKSANISDYDYILFNVTDASADAAIQLRVFVSTEQSSDNSTRVCLYPRPIADYASVDDAAWTTATTITAPGVYVAKITAYPLLRGVKNRAYWQGDAGSIKISMAYVGTGSPVAPVENVVRAGEAALTDPHATCFDITWLEGEGMTFNATNSNALFFANTGELSNTNNVVVGSTCANLALTDGNYPFFTVYDFTATSVSYDRTFTVDQKSTVCLPFALTADEVTEAGTFYELTDYSAGTLTFTEVDETEAYKPYLFKAAKANPFTNYSDKAVDETPANLSVIAGDATMTGTLAKQSVNGKYGWNSVGGAFSKATSDEVTIDAFRAYISLSGVSTARVAARFVESSVTGINEVSETQNVLNPDRKYIENGKIVIVKNGVKYNAAGAQVK